MRSSSQVSHVAWVAAVSAPLCSCMFIQDQIGAVGMWESRSLRFPHFHSRFFSGGGGSFGKTPICDLPFSAARIGVLPPCCVTSTRSDGLVGRSPELSLNVQG